MLKFKMWWIVRIPFLWNLWCQYLLTQHTELSQKERQERAKYLWEAWNKGFGPSLRFTPYEALNASYYRDAYDEGDLLPDDILEMSSNPK